MAEDSKHRWIPLESNPDVWNKYIHNIGTPSNIEFVDVFGLDAEMLMMVPHPVLAVVLLFPIPDKSKESPLGTKTNDSGAYFVKQTIGNACGTIAIVHALANNTSRISFGEDTPFKKFIEKTKDMTPTERAAYLETDKGMGEAHSQSAHEGQTQTPSADEKVNTHFITFVCINNKLYELNGRYDGPILHGNTTSDTLLEVKQGQNDRAWTQHHILNDLFPKGDNSMLIFKAARSLLDTAEVVKKFMARDPEELNFTLMAMVRKQSP